ncbi:glycosyltransferase [Methanobrevibacter sp. OttesenSCG-928-K11]|nr:glycosyltransferase [Methanobrevibacter sp. OttesenSCG-928-K11]MDL2270930.1 glycosyltransferase [Methanobrevibacter sp. OttesenSCG-928-I08]
MKKVLFIAFYFNQDNEIASKRLKGIAKYLHNFNWEPIVLTPKLNNSNSNNTNIKVIETDYIDMLDKWIKKDTSNNSNSSNLPTKENKFLKKAVHIAGEIFAYPDGMKYWYDPCFNAASEIIENEEIDGIISSSWPITSHVIANDLKNKYNIPWIADLRDLWNLNPYISHNFIRNFFEKRLEIKTFENADALTTTTPLASKTLKTLHPNKKIKTILSGYDPDDFKDFKNIKTNKLTFLYAGSLYQGKRDPTLLFKSLNELINEGKINKNKIAIDFYGDNDNLKELASKYNLEEIVNMHGKIPHNEVLKKQKEADVLLLISWMNEQEKMFIPGKVYEYMGSKKPVLSIGFSEGSLKDLILKTNIGFHTSNLDDTKIAICKYYKEYIKENKISYKGNENANNCTMINLSKNFAELLDEVGK